MTILASGPITDRPSAASSVSASMASIAARWCAMESISPDVRARAAARIRVTTVSGSRSKGTPASTRRNASRRALTADGAAAVVKIVPKSSQSSACAAWARPSTGSSCVTNHPAAARCAAARAEESSRRSRCSSRSRSRVW